MEADKRNASNHVAEAKQTWDIRRRYRRRRSKFDNYGGRRRPMRRPVEPLGILGGAVVDKDGPEHGLKYLRALDVRSRRAHFAGPAIAKDTGSAGAWLLRCR